MDRDGRGMKIVSVIAGLVVAGVLIVTFFIILPDSSVIESSLKQANRDVLYLFLFHENPSLAESGTGGYAMLYENMTNGIGRITEPTFEQVHYGIGRDGVYKNWISNEQIERFSSVKMVISDTIEKPDGSPLNVEDISPDARFFYSPYYGATMVMEDDGTMYVMNQDRYNNPKQLPPERMIGVVTLPVEAADYQRIISQYDQIGKLIESYEPRHVQSPPAMLVQGEARDVLANLDPPLELIAETTNGRANVPSDNPTDPFAYLDDTNGTSLKL